MLKAIIFDCDGVIAETETERLKLLKALTEEKGHKGIDEKKHLKLLVGRKSVDFLRDVFGGKMGTEEAEEIAEKRRQHWEDSPKKFIKEIKGIKTVCLGLSKKYEMAVASTAPRRMVEATLKHLELKSYFKVVITGNDVEKVKPNPEAYLKALKGLNVKSGESIAIEDSDTGIAAAKAAGIRTVALRNRLYEEYGYKPDLSKADIIIEELEVLLKIV